MSSSGTLLACDEGEPVAIELEVGRGPFVIVCEHACHALPRALADLGLSAEVRMSHIAWDPGALELARLVAARFDSPLVYQRFSRLAYDCNRPPESAAAMPEVSEIHCVPGNFNLSAEARQVRTDTLYRPFHAAVSGLIDARRVAGLETTLVTVHSFTPVYHGVRREVEIGILHDDDSRLADRMLAAAAAAPRFNVCRNEPYGPCDGVTHSLRLHGLSRGIENVMIEVRNDLLKDKAGQEVVAGYLNAIADEAMAGQARKAKTSNHA